MSLSNARASSSQPGDRVFDFFKPAGQGDYHNDREVMSESEWPVHAQFLIPGVNDTWNNYQKFRKGGFATGKDWKEARQALHAEFQQYISEGGLPTLFDKETYRHGCIADSN